METVANSRQDFAFFYKRNFGCVTMRCEWALIFFNVVLSNFYFEGTKLKKNLKWLLALIVFF